MSIKSAAPTGPSTSSQPVAAARRSRRRGRAWTAVLALSAVAGTSVLASNALFTDRDEITDNAFATGKVSLSQSLTAGALSMANMAPGDSVTKTVTVTNDGTLEARYALFSTMVEDFGLGSLLQVAITGPGGATLLAPTALKDAKVGDAAVGPQAGDRTLAPGASEDLTITVTLPSSATTEQIADAAATARFTFASEQTVNNGTAAPALVPGDYPALVAAAPAVMPSGAKMLLANMPDTWLGTVDMTVDESFVYTGANNPEGGGVYKVNKSTGERTAITTDIRVDTLIKAKGALWGSSVANGRIYRIDPVTGATSVALDMRAFGGSALSPADNLGTDGTHLYYGVNDPSGQTKNFVVRREILANGTLGSPVTLWSGNTVPGGSYIAGLAVNKAGEVFFTGGGALAKISTAGVVTTVVDSWEWPDDFLMTDGGAYLLLGDRVERIDFRTGTQETVRPDMGDWPGAITTDGRDIFVALREGGILRLTND